jgi:hypothetical protein
LPAPAPEPEGPDGPGGSAEPETPAEQAASTRAPHAAKRVGLSLSHADNFILAFQLGLQRDGGGLGGERAWSATAALSARIVRCAYEVVGRPLLFRQLMYAVAVSLRTCFHFDVIIQLGRYRLRRGQSAAMGLLAAPQRTLALLQNSGRSRFGRRGGSPGHSNERPSFDFRDAVVQRRRRLTAGINRHLRQSAPPRMFCTSALGAC